MIRSIVVFPQPDGPSNVTNVFSLIERLKSSMTNSPLYDFEMCDKSIRVFFNYHNPHREL